MRDERYDFPIDDYIKRVDYIKPYANPNYGFFVYMLAILEALLDRGIEVTRDTYVVLKTKRFSIEFEPRNIYVIRNAGHYIEYQLSICGCDSDTFENNVRNIIDVVVNRS